MYKLSHPYLDIKKIAESGQAFRLSETKTGEFELIAGGKYLRIKALDETIGCSSVSYELSCSEEEYFNFYKNYFDMDTDYERIHRSILAEDTFLSSASKYSKGIRILRQDPWEMLITFIISQRKSIPAIKASIEKISEMFGTSIPNSNGRYAFPTPKELAKASMDELLFASLGYRAKYIKSTAGAVEGKEFDLKGLEVLSDEELVQRLLELSGVGVKVANCVALFGYHRINAFPIDVWIQKVLDQFYNGSFDTKQYDGFLGVIQQFMFYYGRSIKI